MQKIASEDLGDGESKRADQTLADRLPRSGQRGGPRSRAAATSRPTTRGSRGGRDVVRVCGVRHVRDIQSPLDAGNQSQFSPDGRSALVTFDLLGDDDVIEDNVDAGAGGGRTGSGGQPGPAGRAVRRRQHGQGRCRRPSRTTSSKAETLSLPITLVILVVAFGALAAAGVPLLLAISAVAAALGLVGARQPGRARRPEHLVGDPADRARRRRRLLALLPAPRARGARGGELRGRRRCRRPRPPPGRAVLVSGVTVIIAMAGMYLTGNADLHLVRDRHDPRRRDRGARLAHRAAGRAVEARRSRRAGPRPVPRAGMRDGRRRSRLVVGASSTRVLQASRPLRWCWRTAVLVALAIPAFSLHTVNTGVNGLPRDLPDHADLRPHPGGLPRRASLGDRGCRGARRRERADEDGHRAAQHPGGRHRRDSSSRSPTTINPDKTVAEVSIPIAGNGTDDSVGRRARRAARRRHPGRRSARCRARAPTYRDDRAVGRLQRSP